MSHIHTQCVLCKELGNKINILRHIRRRHGNILKGTFKVCLCMLCLKAGCEGGCDGRESRRSQKLVLQNAQDNAESHLGILLKEKTVKVMRSDTPKIVVCGTARKECDSSATLDIFEQAVNSATSFENV